MGQVQLGGVVLGFHVLELQFEGRLLDNVQIGRPVLRVGAGVLPYSYVELLPDMLGSDRGQMLGLFQSAGRIRFLSAAADVPRRPAGRVADTADKLQVVVARPKHQTRILPSQKKIYF